MGFSLKEMSFVCWNAPNTHKYISSIITDLFILAHLLGAQTGNRSPKCSSYDPACVYIFPCQIFVFLWQLKFVSNILFFFFYQKKKRKHLQNFQKYFSSYKKGSFCPEIFKFLYFLLPPFFFFPHFSPLFGRLSEKLF